MLSGQTQSSKKAPRPSSGRSNWRSQRNIAWIEKYCHIPEGKFAGKPVKLTKQQRQWIVQIYDSPTRLFILTMGRKNAKTTFIGFLLLLHLCGPESQQNSQLYSAAQSKDQAAIIYELTAKMVRMDADLSSAVVPRDTIKELICHERGTLYKALSAEATTAFGLSPVFVVHDELGQVKGPRSQLYEALETASAAHDNPLSLVISTQAPNDSDLLSLLIDDAKTEADPRNKVVMHTAPMDLDPFSLDAIRAANPHYEDFMNKEEVQRQANDAKRMPSREASYRNLILNQRVEARSPFVAREIWKANGAPQLGRMSGRLYVGLDLSSVSDLTSAEIIENVGDGWDVHSNFWLPEEGLVEKARSDRVPYDKWAEDGLLHTTPGRSIEYAFIAAWLRDLFDNHDVGAVAFDRYNMKFLKPWLEKVGFTEAELEKFVEFGQGFVSMSPAIRELESLLLANKLRHGNHPVLTMCAQNTVVKEDEAENRKFVKGKATGRIDGMVALAMAVGAAGIHKPAPNLSYDIHFV